jgi:Protein of unknown function (DUF3592)
MRKFDNSIIILVYGWLFIISFCFGGYGIMELRELQRGQVSQDWQKTRGTVTTSWVLTGSRDGSSNPTMPMSFRGGRSRGVSSGGGGPTRSLVFAYTYTVGGKSYEGEKIHFGSMSDPDELVKRYPAGSEVAVYYDPNDPTRATLERGTEQSTTIVLAICGGVIGLCLLGGLLFPLYIRHYNKTPPKKKKNPVKKTAIPHKKNGIVTLVMGILSLACYWMTVLGWMILVMTIGFGYINLESIKENKEKDGKVLTIAGLVLGCTALIIKILILLDVLEGPTFG